MSSTRKISFGYAGFRCRSSEPNFAGPGPLQALWAQHFLMLGPPGSGKTMLAKRIPSILPTLTAAESIETTRVYSAMGMLKPGQPLMMRRPFRSPHHTISNAGLCGVRFPRISF